jgi:vacuolar protein sorting-associated protein 13A/C
VTLIKHLETQSLGESDQFSLFKQLGELYLTMTTFENAPLKINALEVSNVFGDRREVTDLFKGYYKQQLKRNMFNFLGASNLLGNPIGFLNSVSTGMKDFWYEPTQGMMIGPAETASGLFRGTKSLLSNTMMGSLDSFGKISS